MFRTTATLCGFLALTLTVACGGMGSESYTDGDPDRPVITAAPAVTSSATPAPTHTGDVPVERPTFSKCVGHEEPPCIAAARAPHADFRNPTASIACAGCHPEAGDSKGIGPIRWQGGASPAEPFPKEIRPIADISVTVGCATWQEQGNPCADIVCPVGKSGILRCTTGPVACGGGTCVYW